MDGTRASEETIQSFYADLEFDPVDKGLGSHELEVEIRPSQ